MTRALNRDQVREIVGAVDDLTAAQLISTGVDASTLVSALRGVERELLLGEQQRKATESDAYARAHAILFELMENEVEDDFTHAVDVSAATD